MTDRPIIFSAPMVRALIKGRKTQTRRVLKPQPSAGVRFSPFVQTGLEDGHGREIRPRFLPGDRLWVRETWADVNTDGGPGIGYRADGDFYQPEYDGEDFGAGPSYNYEKYPGNYTMWFSDLLAGSPGHGWRSPMFMPRWASRITLAVADVRVQRLQEISDDDAKAEGLSVVDAPGDEANGCWTWEGATDFLGCWSAASGYGKLWDSLHGPGSFEANPWVAAISFTVATRNIDAPETGEPHVRHD